MRQIHSPFPSLAPSSYPSPQQQAPPPPNAPQGRKNREGRGNWAWGQGRTRGDNRTGQTALAENGAERRRRRRKGQKRIIVVVRIPCQENYPEDAHPSAHKSVLELANPAWTRSVHLDAPGQRHGQQPVSGTADPGAVKQDKSSRGSVDTTKTRSDPQRVRTSSGERPIGAAKGKQPNTEALCQPPPPPPDPQKFSHLVGVRDSNRPPPLQRALHNTRGTAPAYYASAPTEIRDQQIVCFQFVVSPPLQRHIDSVFLCLSSITGTSTSSDCRPEWGGDLLVRGRSRLSLIVQWSAAVVERRSRNFYVQPGSGGKQRDSRNLKESAGL